MSKGYLSHFLLLTILFFCSLTYAQTQKESKKELLIVLSQLEVKFNISFSFADKSVENIKVTIPKNTNSLFKALKSIEKQTDLIFEKLSQSTYVIRYQEKENFFQTQLLDEVIITDYLTQGLSLLDNGVTAIKQKQFGILPGLSEPDVLQTVLALPGVQSIDERISNLNIRGGTHDQNLILWDGIKMYKSGHFFGLISAINPYLTDDVKVAKNGTSAMYGDGVSGLIDMTTSSEITNETEIGLGINMISADAYAKIPLRNNLELQISARRSLTDLLESPTYNQFSKRVFQDSDLTQFSSNALDTDETFYFYDTSAKLSYKASKKDEITFNGLVIYNNLNYDEQGQINSSLENYKSNLTQSNNAFGIQYKRTWNSKFETFAQLYVTKYNLDATNFDVINDQRLIQENEVIDGGLKLHATYKLDKTLGYFGGYQFSEVGIANLEDVLNPNFRKYVKNVLRTHSIFNEVNFLSNSKQTSARIGFRTNFIEKFSELYFEPRLSFSQKIVNDFRVFVLGELKSQTTSQIIDLQNDFLGIEKRRWVLSNNENIPILRSKQISAGIEYNKHNLTLSGEAFFKSVDGVTTRSQGFQNQYQFIDAIGRYDIKGVDVLINKKFKTFSTWLTYSITDNNYIFEDLNFGNKFPNNSHINHALTFAGAYNFNNLKISVGVNYRSGRPFTMPLDNNAISGNEIQYQSPNSSNIDNYFRADLSANYRFRMFSNSAEIGLSVWNVLNRKNIINTYYSLNSDNTISKIENQSLGLTPNASFRIKF